MRVLLVNSPYVDIYGPIKTAAGRYFPLGLGYIAAFLKKRGYEVILIDPEAQRLNDQDIRRIIGSSQPDVVGISCATPNFANAIKISELSKSVTDCPVVIGGVHASAVPETIIHIPSVDYVVIGEGEYTMYELCEYIKGNRPTPDPVPGLMCKNGKDIIRSSPRPLITDLDSLPWPARELIDISLYRPHSHNVRHKRSATMLSSRGCPFQCTFCASYLTMGDRFRPHSPEYVVGEIEYLVKYLNIKHILIVDDTFTVNPERAKIICEMLLRKGIEVEWFCFAHVNTISKELVKLMKRAGCYSIGFGVESADEGVLKNMKKNLSLDRCIKAFEISNKLGIKTQAFFIFGNKGDTPETINKTIKFAFRLRPVLAFFNILIPYPGTEAFEELCGPLFSDGNPDWTDFVAIGVNPAVDTFSLTKKELQKYVYRANFKFYFRFEQILRMLYHINSLYELSEYIRGAWALLMQSIIWRRKSKKREIQKYN